jgi:hypothetical protein
VAPLDEHEGVRSLLDLVATLAGAVGVVYVVGGGVLSLRYEGFGLSAQRSVALLQREYVFFAGFRSLVIWGLIGGVVILALGRSADRIRKLGGHLESRPVRFAAGGAVLALLLILVLRVWWPLAAVFGLPVALAAQLYWNRPLAKLAAAVATIVLIAVTYEADRITYVLERVYVELGGDVDAADLVDVASPSTNVESTTAKSIVGGEMLPFCARREGRICGILIAQTGQGLYVGLPGATSVPRHNRYPGAIAFVPERNVKSFVVEKTQARVPDVIMDRRRKLLRERILEPLRQRPPGRR